MVLDCTYWVHCRSQIQATGTKPPVTTTTGVHACLSKACCELFVTSPRSPNEPMKKLLNMWDKLYRMINLLCNIKTRNPRCKERTQTLSPSLPPPSKRTGWRHLAISDDTTVRLRSFSSESPFFLTRLFTLQGLRFRVGALGFSGFGVSEIWVVLSVEGVRCSGDLLSLNKVSLNVL